MKLPERVSIVEVGPRDGLQNEDRTIPLTAKLELIEDLAAAGLKRIETGSFVNPKWVPQMADSEEVFAGITRKAGVRYSALTPNLQGFERALAAGADEVAVFAAASEDFSRKNINCSISESLQRFQAVMSAAESHDVPVRGYVSCVLGCPLAGDVSPSAVASVVKELLDMGCYEVSLGDTIGTGTPGGMNRLLDSILRSHPVDALAEHCHDTYGQALANILVALQRGITTIDSAVAGLGGCPYAEGATGNVATEDVVFMLQGSGIACDIDMDKLISAGRRITAALGKPPASRAAIALSARGR